MLKKFRAWLLSKEVQAFGVESVGSGNIACYQVSVQCRNQIQVPCT